MPIITAMNDSSRRAPNFRTLDLNLLRVFDVVMRERQVTRAARLLSMTQPAVSNALRRMRQALGEELFHSGPTGVVPTPAAQALWPVVHDALERLQAAMAPQQFDPNVRPHAFLLRMAEATAALLVPPLTRRVRQPGSKVSLRVQGLTTRDPRTLLEQGEADVALGYFPEVSAALAVEARDAAMRMEPLFDVHYVAVMRREHPLAAVPRLSLPAYCDAEHVRVSFAARPRGFVDEALERLGRQRQVVLTVGDFATALQALRGGDLLAVLPRGYVGPANDAADRGLVVRPLPFPLDPLPISLLWHRRHETDAAHQWLRRHLHDAASALVPARPRRAAASGSSSSSGSSANPPSAAAG
jgi:DNA-binding transcriptional LysR family regulator